ncbi:MAG: glycosyltransferase family A protein [Myxococcaceae bacterium]|nr:glycosyltransferase family A protein [Myxococcaceae bacterium]
MAAQTAHDLRTVVTRRVGVDRRVVVLASDLALVRALEANRCVVLADPSSLDEVTTFQPDVVVAFDGFVLKDGGAAFRSLAQAAGQAELVFSFANAASASTLLLGLTGSTPPVTFAEPEVRRWLASAGYVVNSRDVVVTPHRSTGLSADTEAALRQVLEQVNPDAAADRLLLCAKRGTVASTPDRTEGLVSVVVSAGADEALLAGTLASLLNQHRRPLELIVVATLPLERLDRALEKAKARSGVTAVGLTHASSDSAARTNAGLAAAQGQYVAFAEAGALFSPLHLSGLVRRLEEGTQAWALAAASVSGQPVVERPPVFSVGAWLVAGWVSRLEWLVDTSRLGPFALTFPEGVEQGEAALFTRLSLLFPPAWAPGTPSVEPLAATSVNVSALLEATRARPLRGLVTLEQLLAKPPTPDLAALVKERLEAVDPRLGQGVERVAGVLKRVRSAWHDARRDAERELAQK